MNAIKNMIFIGSYGHVACIDELSGKELWRTSLPGTGYNPVTCYLEDARLYVGSNGKFFILCANSGKILAQNEMIGQGYGFLTFATKRSESAPQQNVPQILPQPIPQPLMQPQFVPQPGMFPPQMMPVPPPPMMPPFQVLPQPNLFPQSNEMIQPNMQSPIFIVSPMINQPQQPQQPQFVQFQQPQLLQFDQPQELKIEQIKNDEEYARQLEKELNGGGVQNQQPNNVNVNRAPQPIFFNPVVPRQHACTVDDLIFVGLNNYLTALNKYTAQEVWKTQLNAFAGLPVSVVFSKGNLIVGASGNVSCYNALTGQELWQNKLPGLRYTNVSVITTSNNNTIANSSPTHYFQGN